MVDINENGAFIYDWQIKSGSTAQSLDRRDN